MDSEQDSILQTAPVGSPVVEGIAANLQHCAGLLKKGY